MTVATCNTDGVVIDVDANVAVVSIELDDDVVLIATASITLI
jgi:hypothetical protein